MSLKDLLTDWNALTASSDLRLTVPIRVSAIHQINLLKK